MISDGDGFLRIFHTESKVLHGFISKEIRFTAGRDYEFIVRKFCLAGNNFVLLGNNFFDLAHAVLNVARALENFSEREGNIARFNSATRNLIKKRLKHVVIHFIDDNYFFAFPV